MESFNVRMEGAHRLSITCGLKLPLIGILPSKRPMSYEAEFDKSNRRLGLGFGSAHRPSMKDSMIRSTVSPTASKESINRGKNYEDGGLEVVAIKGLEISKPVHQVKPKLCFL